MFDHNTFYCQYYFQNILYSTRSLTSRTCCHLEYFIKCSILILFITNIIFKIFYQIFDESHLLPFRIFQHCHSGSGQAGMSEKPGFFRIQLYILSRISLQSLINYHKNCTFETMKTKILVSGLRLVVMLTNDIKTALERCPVKQQNNS